MQKCEKCYMTFKITPFCKKRKRKFWYRKKKQNYIKVNRSQLKIFFFFLQYNTMSYVGIDSVCPLEGMSFPSIFMTAVAVADVKSSFAFFFSSLTHN